MKSRHQKNICAASIFSLAICGVIACNKTPISVPAATALGAIESPEGTARVYFVRPQLDDEASGQYAVSVWDGDNLVAFIRAGQAFAADLSPGRHVFLAFAKDSNMLIVDLEAGNTYTIHVHMRDKPLFDDDSTDYDVNSNEGEKTAALGDYIVKKSLKSRLVTLDLITPDDQERWNARTNWLEQCRPMSISVQGAAEWTAKRTKENPEIFDSYKDLIQHSKNDTAQRTPVGE